ncbi:MAG: hypothetical protein LBD34_01045 [Puniceicoccales bacterium]|jgi:hypothetical protein|nr:hypothetical protein [Puniceicoccales bacterium]
MNNRKIKNVIFFVVGLLVVFARLNIMALPLFNGNGSLTEGSKYLCQALEIDDKVTNAQQFTEFFQTNFLGNTEEESLEKCDSIFDKNTFEKVFEKPPYAYVFKFDKNIFEKPPEKLLRAYELLGMKQAILPKKAKYDYVIIFGSMTNDMVEECRFIRDKIANIISNDPDTKIFFITSQRPLGPKFESTKIEQLKDRNLPQTEIYAAQLTWEQELGEYSFSCKFVNDEQIVKSQDFIESLELSPGAVVVVSANPFIALRDNMFRNVLWQRWFESSGTLETVGPADDFPYEKINYIKDLKTKRAIQYLMIWCYINTITSYAIEEFKQLTIKK